MSFIETQHKQFKFQDLDGEDSNMKPVDLNGTETEDNNSFHTTAIASFHQDDIMVNGGKKSHLQLKDDLEAQPPQSKWKRFTKSLLLAHLLMVGHLLLFGGFCVLNPKATEHINTIIFSCWRTCIMFITILPFAVVVDRKFVFRNMSDNHNKFQKFIFSRTPGAKDAILLALCGLMQILNLVLFTYGTQLTSPTIAGILQPTTTIFTCIISVVLGREGFAILKTIGVIIAFVGSLLMFVFSGIVHHSGNPFKLLGWTAKGVGGCVLLILGGICTAIFLITQKTLLNRKVPPLTASSWSLGFASIFSAFISLIFINRLSIHNLPAITWVGLFYAGLAYGSLNYAMTAYAAKLTSPTVISIYATAYPLISIVFLYIFLRETSTWLVLIGAAIISLGVTLVAVSQSREGNWQEKDALRRANLIGSENLGIDTDLNTNRQFTDSMSEAVSPSIEASETAVEMKNY